MINIVKRLVLVLLVVSVVNTAVVTAQNQELDPKIVAKIRAEGFQRSKIMPAVQELTDEYGPRLTNSPNIKRAQTWTMALMKEWGLENIKLDPWGEFGTGWEIEGYSVEMTTPTYDRLNAMPLAWTPGTNGIVTGTPELVTIKSEADFAKYRGKRAGKIVMNGPADDTNKFKAPAKRLETDDLEKTKGAIDPLGNGIGGGKSVNYREEDKDWKDYLKQRRGVIAFLKSEGVAVLLQPSAFPYGVVRAAGFYETDADKNLPAFVIGKEQYSRIGRLLVAKKPVSLRIDLRTRFTADRMGYNIIGEIPGTDPKLKSEVVMLGGHFDSWHGGTGVADNGANCIVMLEAMRILKTIGVKPKRTIRVGLWSGEEQDYFGSYNYVKKHYGDPKTGEKKPDHNKLSAYFNLDNGGGKIRGIYLQGNEGARSIFESYLRPFKANGADTVTILNTGGTDHMVFDGIGLPGFQFIQDPLDYSSRVHHSNMDLFESVIEDDLKLNAVIVAVFAYQTSMRDEMIPRE